MKNSERLQRVDTIKRKLDNEGVDLVFLNFIGPDGDICSKCSLTGLDKLHMDELFFDGVAVNGRLIPGWDNTPSAEWLLLIPDLRTLWRSPQLEGPRLAFMMGGFPSFELDPRSCATRVVDYANSLGFTPMCGTSIFYTANNSEFNAGLGAYQLPPHGPLTKLSLQLATDLRKMGIGVEYFQPICPTHCVMDFVPTTLTEALDNLAIARWYMDSVGLREVGGLAFSPPKAAIPLCDNPVHISLWNSQRNQNLFFDSDDELELSDLSKHFIAGILFFLPQLATIIQLSSRELYKQTWRCSYSDRRDDAIIHVPVYMKERGKKDRVGWGKRLLFNGLLHGCNMHICVPAVLLAGLEGIQRRLDPDDVADARQTTSPPDLSLLKDDSIFREIMGDAIIDWLVERGGQC